MSVDPHRSDNPVSDYLAIEDAGVSSVVHRQNIKKLLALKTELTGNVVELGYMLSSELQPRHVQCDCIKLLLHTLYVDMGPQLMQRFYELQWRLSILESEPGIAPEVLAESQALIRELDAVVAKLRVGAFAEPAQVTSMVWEQRSSTPTSLFQRCEVAGPTKHVLLRGESGTGKTAIAAGLALLRTHAAGSSDENDDDRSKTRDPDE